MTTVVKRPAQLIRNMGLAAEAYVLDRLELSTRGFC
jgi:hypothetical protein